MPGRGLTHIGAGCLSFRFAPRLWSTRLAVAFTKEESAETASETLLPERTISPHPNLVTAAGLKALESQLEEARAALKATASIEDVNERRRQAAGPARDVRYLAIRVGSAKIVSEPETTERVAFGSTVTFSRDDGRVQTYRIVGEDEADPTRGTMSFASPIARFFMGKSAGDAGQVNGQEIEIISIA